MSSIYTFLCNKDWGKVYSLLSNNYIFYKIDHYNKDKISPLIFLEINKNIYKSKSYIKNDTYLCMKEGMELLFRETLRGTYVVDQSLNKQSIIISLGSEYEDAVICGTIGTISKDTISINIYKEWTKAIRKNSIKIGTFYVGRGLIETLKSKGKRFTTDLSSPIESDLIYE